MGASNPEYSGKGFFFKRPFVQSVIEMEVRTQKIETSVEASSSDLQEVHTKSAMNHLYNTIGLDYTSRVISPALSESLKQSTALFTAEELITKRAKAKDATLEALRARLRPLGIIVEAISITDFQFSKAFNDAIEAKVTAEQLKLKADRDLERIQTEAKQTKAKAEGEKSASIAKAEGDAQAIKVVTEQLSASPLYLEWMKINRWDGKLPTVTGGAIPMINVGK